MSRKPQLNRHEWLLLSAYLDGELSNREKRQVEEWLQNDPASRTALEGLRRTRQVLRHAPQKPVPHNFTLTPDMLRKPLLPSFSRMFSYSAALAGLLLVAVLGMDLFGSMTSPQMARNASEPVMQTFKTTEDTAAVEKAAPQIIYWGNSGPLMGAYGKGGGGDGSGMAYGVGGGGGGGAPIGGGVESEPSIPMEQVPLEETLPLEEAAPAPAEALPEAGQMQPEQTAPAEQSLLGATPMPEVPEAEALTGSAPDSGAVEPGSSPILGIRPADQQGRVEPQTRVQMQTIPEVQSQLPLRKAEIILALLAILLGLAAFFSRKLSG
ncbi:anti-sigma factor family protein [Pelolinea submarina]|uniref:Putative zinc finger protein n=1 Tax=Pelolinea submarina TaxID=913107 RepID=A0A347ZVJ8_9CHLR|nr:zf-HC2 domain-containing protein [Pelolinea submarina]REG07026.1 putative zinc finger protein [Pelolinea submarina]BBB49329.1 hypothetical protein Pelsub_P2560 [Pelolinea submarina]